MKTMITKLVLLFALVSLAGCTNVNNQDVGAVTGAVAGGLLGSQFGGGGGKMLAIGAGAVAGALIGGAIGKSMDDTDRLKMSRALESQPVGQPTYWQNSQTGASYTVIPENNVTVSGNPYCREYHTIATVAGKKQQIYGTACRQPDGTWKVVSGE
jgi:surface antigen